MPLVSHLDYLLLHLFPLRRVPLLGSMLHDLLQVIWVNGVEDIEEVLSARCLLLCILVLEVDGECRVIFQVRPQPFGAKLFEARYMDVADLVLLEQLLLSREDLPHEVLVHLLLRWHVVLDYRY